MLRSDVLRSGVFTSAVFLFILAINAGTNVYAQTIQYSRQNFKAPYADAMQLVANVSGNHHILCFTQNEKITLYVYDNMLQLRFKKEVPVKLHEYDDINIIPFSDFYFLYVHQPGSIKHELWKVNAQGNATSVSELFRGLIETVLKKNTSTLQLINKNNRLFIIANTYYDELKKIGSTVTQTDENLNIMLSRKVFYGFKKHEESLKQVMLAGDDLLILKTSKDTGVHLLQMIKVNLNTGKLVMNSFSSGSNLFLNPTFSYNQADSGILIYSMIERTVFITELDYSLNEKIPVTLLKRQFRNNTPFNFLLLYEPQKWLSMHIGNKPYHITTGRYTNTRSGINSPFDYNSGFDVYGNLVLNDPRYSARNMSASRTADPYSASNYPYTSAVRFSLLSNNFTLSKDSVVANDKNAYTIQPALFASAVLQNKSYLFLGQQFGTNRQGLLMMHSNNKSDLSATDIRVYDKYKYLLPQLQAVNDQYVILPYTHKKRAWIGKDHARIIEIILL